MNFDVVINGGGMVGAATALALAEAGLSIAVIEAKPPKLFSVDQAMDLRVSALNLASQNLLTELGAWQAIEQMRATVFKRLEVWDIKGGKTAFDNHQIKQPYLGHIVENRVIQLALWQQFEKKSEISLYTDTQLADIEYSDKAWQVSLSCGATFSGKLLVAADGANSEVRKYLKIGTQGWNYRQQAFVIGITTEFEQQDITWQQMTPSGPRAFLPLSGHHGSLVWYDAPERIKQLKQSSKDRLKQQILNEFPTFSGDFEINDTASFPLTRMHANHYYANAAVLLGDAAHTINPLAGQGVNLGFKDVKVFRDVVENGLRKGTSIADIGLLKQYQKARRPDNLIMMTAMDSFYTLFGNDNKPLQLLRSGMLSFVDKVTPLKSTALKYATGLIG
jgi:2-octaprenyl-3-methyl-6-methoxy-1,4-benzoquinol hydroxylase